MAIPSVNDLTSKKCRPCEGGVPVIPPEHAADYLKATPLWNLDDEGKAIYRKIHCKHFVDAMELLNRVAEIAESEQHHPDLHLTGYRNVRIELTTHAIGGLSENDFILAAKVDQVVP